MQSGKQSKAFEIISWIWIGGMALLGAYVGISYGWTDGGLWQAIGFGIIGFAGGALIASLAPTILQFLSLVR